MSNWFWLVFVLGTVLCWGAYGPTLHKGQAALGNDPWKAILCVGGAYFVLAVIVPLVILKLDGKPLDFTGTGTLFAGIAGALGALGAMCIAGSLRTGGKPLYVMPLVFGCAPVVNIAVSSLLHRPERAPHVAFYAGIVLLGLGAALVLYFKPQ
ncbi:MAG: hypothetical protein HY721_28430 [Planctomycetes bacterium]|nr:hypothetical protein [Planctomycetota bacterium]